MISIIRFIFKRWSSEERTGGFDFEGKFSGLLDKFDGRGNVLLLFTDLFGGMGLVQNTIHPIEVNFKRVI